MRFKHAFTLVLVSFAIGSLISVGLLLIGQPKEAEALLSPERYGYFKGNYGPLYLSEESVLTNGYLTSYFSTGDKSEANRDNILNPANARFDLDDKEAFISHIISRLGSSGKDATGAAFIIQTMRGIKGAASGGSPNRPPTSSDIDDWKKRVRNDDIEIKLWRYTDEDTNSAYVGTYTETENETTTCSRPMFDGTTSNPCNPPSPSSGSGWGPVGSRSCSDNRNLGITICRQNWRRTVDYTNYNDVLFYPHNATLPAMAFVSKSTGVVYYLSKINCGNAIGNLPGLPLNWQYTLNSPTISGGNNPGDTFTVESVFHNTGLYPGDSVQSSWHGHRIYPKTSTDANNVTWVSANSGGVQDGGSGHPKSSLWTNFGPMLTGTGATHRGTWRINNGVASGTNICFRVEASPVSGPVNSVSNWGPLTNERCFAVGGGSSGGDDWIYTVDVTVPSGTLYPGATFNVSSRVDNITDKQGLSYRHGIATYEGENYLTMVSGGDGSGAASKDAVWSTNAGLTTNTRTHTGSWRINSNTPANTLFCFRGIIDPSEGTGTTVTKGRKDSPHTCFRTARNRYTYNPNTSISGTIQAGSTITVNGRITNNGTGGTGHPYTERIYANWGSGWLLGSDGTWNESGLANGSSRTRNRNYTIANNIPDGELICFTTSVDPNRGLATPGVTTDEGGPATDEYCFRVIRNKYNYVPLTSVAGSVYAGSDIVVRGSIRNAGTGGTGHPYTESIINNWGSGWVTRTTAAGPWNESGLANGGTRSRTINYTVDVNTPHNELLCWTTIVDPNSGLATPGVTTDGGTDARHEYCYRVVNERFDLAVSVVSDGSAISQPGTDHEITYTICNSDALPAGSIRGIAPNVGISISGDMGPNMSTTRDISSDPNNCWQQVRNFTVPASSNVGDLFCTTITTNKDRGFSNDTYVEGTNSETFCTKVGITPYLHVTDGDVWAGADFYTEVTDEVPASCPPTGNPHSNSKIESVRSDLSSLWRGSFVEYAAYATGPIISFGSDGNPGDANNTTLTFATDPNSGNYTDAPKCIANYFELLNDYDYNVPGTDVTDNSRNLSAFSQNKEQFRIRPTGGTFTLTGNNTNYSKHQTIVIDGNLVLPNNIEFDTSYNNSSNLDVPSLIFVVKGNIYIDQSVKNIDAILISHGDIWTCTNGSVPIKELAEGVCYEPLTINGAIIANRVNFMRTRELFGTRTGGVHDANSGPAEVINFLPEFFLSEPIFKSNKIGEDAFETVLTKDLPPVY